MFATVPARNLQMEIYQRAKSVVQASLTGAFEDVKKQRDARAALQAISNVREKIKETKDAVVGESVDGAPFETPFARPQGVQPAVPQDKPDVEKVTQPIPIQDYSTLDESAIEADLDPELNESAIAADLDPAPPQDEPTLPPGPPPGPPFTILPEEKVETGLPQLVAPPYTEASATEDTPQVSEVPTTEPYDLTSTTEQIERLEAIEDKSLEQLGELEALYNLRARLRLLNTLQKQGIDYETAKSILKTPPGLEPSTEDLRELILGNISEDTRNLAQTSTPDEPAATSTPDATTQVGGREEPRLEEVVDMTATPEVVEVEIAPVATPQPPPDPRLQNLVEFLREADYHMDRRHHLRRYTDRNLYRESNPSGNAHVRIGGRSATIAMNKLKKGLVPKARPNKLIKELLLMVGGPEELELAKQMGGRERLGTLRKKYKGENAEIRLLLS